MQTVSERKENFYCSRIIHRKMEKKIDSPDEKSEVYLTGDSALQPTVSEAPPSYNNVIQQQTEIIPNWNVQKDPAAPKTSAVTIQPMLNSQVWWFKTKRISKTPDVNKHIKVPPIPADFNYQIFSCLEEPTMCLKAMFIPCWSFYGVYKLVDNKKGMCFQQKKT
jgi:hypothetical protein